MELANAVKERDCITSFLYGLKSQESKKKYPQRLKVFLRFLGIEGDVREQAGPELLKRARENPLLLEDKLMEFIEFQKARMMRERKSPATIANY
jgi:hypothetical protein